MNKDMAYVLQGDPVLLNPENTPNAFVLQVGLSLRLCPPPKSTSSARKLKTK